MKLNYWTGRSVVVIIDIQEKAVSPCTSMSGCGRVDLILSRGPDKIPVLTEQYPKGFGARSKESEGIRDSTLTKMDFSCVLAGIARSFRR